MNIKHIDARLLREALAHIYKKGSHPVKAYVNKILKQYANSVGNYCTCIDTVFIDNEMKFACLDCGKRHDEKPKQSLGVRPMNQDELDTQSNSQPHDKHSSQQ